MQKRYLIKLLLTLVLFAVAVSCKSQNNFKYLSNLPTIDSEGFYKIELTSGIVAKCNNNLSDIRILDENFSEVSYILKSDLPSFTKGNFIEFPILSKTVGKDKHNNVTIENKNNRTINNLCLFIKNADVNRTVILSGSDDNKKWYIIRENILLNISTNPGEDYFSYSLPFPQSSYKFFKIILPGEKLLPVNIIKTGIYETQVTNGEFEKLPLPVLKQYDSNKTSFVTAAFDDNYVLDELSIDATGPKFFKRNLRIYVTAGNSKQTVINSLIGSDTERTYSVGDKTKLIRIEIENDDNTALKINKVTGYQLKKYLLAYLVPGKNYNLLFGDSLATVPVYDLRFFNDSINNVVKNLASGPIEKRTIPNEKEEQQNNSYEWLLWGSIILVLIILLILSTGLMKDINKKSRT